jgi:hypothetical protein
MFPLPESNWLGRFAVNVAFGYEIGTARGDRTVLSAMDIGRDEFFAHFGQSVNQLLLAHRSHLERKRKMRPSTDPKTRWVDGTPEYSFYVYALRKLFPGALFIHIVRDVRDVVRSMLNFHRLAGFPLVANEEEAYRYWLRAVKACVMAENAFGTESVHRLRYSDLINKAEESMRKLLFFLNEPYCSRCLDPLAKRINSSNVPEDFVADDPGTNQDIVAEALKLSSELEKAEQPTEGSPEGAKALALEFDRTVKTRR